MYGEDKKWMNERKTTRHVEHKNGYIRNDIVTCGDFVTRLCVKCEGASRLAWQKGCKQGGVALNVTDSTKMHL